jgi:hypothetical protein
MAVSISNLKPSSSRPARDLWHPAFLVTAECGNMSGSVLVRYRLSADRNNHTINDGRLFPFSPGMFHSVSDRTFASRWYTADSLADQRVSRALHCS